MSSRIKSMSLTLVGIISIMLLFCLMSNKTLLILPFTRVTSVLNTTSSNLPLSAGVPIAGIVRGNFTCESWRNASYVNASKFQECLMHPGDSTFWTFEGLRHTAHRHLFNASSLIIEIGGNRAHDTVKFIEFHNPWIISFEPLIVMANNLTEKFKSNPKVQIYPYGLGNRARKLSIEPNDYGNAGTSIFRPLTSPNSSAIVQIQLLDIVEVIHHVRRTRTRDGLIGMLSINCEGCEFEVIPALILNNLTQYFRVIQFASHLNLVQNSACTYCQIEQALQLTHQTLYYFPKIWEGWVLKNKTRN